MNRNAFRSFAAVVAASGIALGAAPAGHATDGDTPRQHAEAKASALRADAPGPSGTRGSCRLQAPVVVRVVQPVTTFPVSLTGGCAIDGAPSAAWFTGNDTPNSEWVSFSGTLRSTWTMDDNTPLGEQTWQPFTAYSPKYGQFYTQNTLPFSVRVGSWAGLVATRSGSTVTLKTRAVRYATSLDRNIPWAGATGTVYRVYSNGGFDTVRKITLNSKGESTVSFRSSSTQKYVVYLDGQKYIWLASTPTKEI